MEFLDGPCKCRICNTVHYCPDDCGEHFKTDTCICVPCYLKEIESPFQNT